MKMTDKQRIDWLDKRMVTFHYRNYDFSASQSCLGRLRYYIDWAMKIEKQSLNEISKCRLKKLVQDFYQEAK